MLGLSPEGNVFILDIYRRRGVSFSEQIALVIKKAEEWKPLKIGIETNAYQAALAQELERLTRLPIIELTTVKDKIMRAQMRSGRVESGRVYAMSTMHDFVSELTLLEPNCEHDDQFDGFDFALTVSEAGQQVASSNYFIPEFESNDYYNIP